MRWQQIAIQDFAEVVTGGTPSTRKPEYWGGEIPWLGSGELNAGEIHGSKKFITKDGLANSSARMMPPHTVMIALTGATVGVTGYLNIHACANQSVTGILPTGKHVPRYLYYYLKSIRQRIIDDAYGGGQPHISQGYVKKIMVPLPPLEEQKRIAGILDEADLVRKKTQALIDKYDELAQSLFLDMFGDPVTNPKGWEVMTIGDSMLKGYVLRMQDGNHGEIHPKSADFQTTGIPMIFANNLKGNDLNYHNGHHLSDEVASGLRIGFAQGGDVLLTHKGSIGLCDVVPDSVDSLVLSPQVTYYRLNRSRLNPTYLKFYFTSQYFFGCMMKYGKQSTRLYIGITKQRRLPLMVPDIAVQNQFSTKIDSLKVQIARAKLTLNKEGDLFNALLQKAFKGELS